MPPASAPSSTSCEQAKTKGLSVVSGLCLRYDNGFRETVKRIHDGAIGEVVTLLRQRLPRAAAGPSRASPDWTDMTYQMRNWYNFTWLSGDFNVEQHVHFLDVCAWVMKDEYPVKAVGMGGRQVLTGPEYGQHLRPFLRGLRVRQRREAVQQLPPAAGLQERHERAGRRARRAGPSWSKRTRRPAHPAAEQRVGPTTAR